MTDHLIFIPLALMLAGYASVEAARFRRSRERAEPHAPYPAGRLALRLTNALLLAVLAGTVIYRDSPLEPGTVHYYALPAGLALLALLLLADIAGVFLQYRRESRRREEQFLDDMARVLEGKGRPGGGAG